MIELLDFAAFAFVAGLGVALGYMLAKSKYMEMYYEEKLKVRKG